MGLDWWRALRASSRFGRAVRLQESGALAEAKEAFLVLDRWCDQRHDSVSPAFISVRMMVLIHLAETARELGDGALSRASLEKWLREHERIVNVPSLGTNNELSRWEAWVRASLAADAGPAKT